MNTLETITTTSCPISGGKKRKFRGGFKITKEQITSLLYVIIAAIATIAITGTNSRETVYSGLKMMINGECGYVANRVWGYLGLENPVCAIFNAKMSSVMKALVGNVDAINELTLLVGKITASSLVVHVSVKKITDIVYPLIQSEEAPVPVINP